MLVTRITQGDASNGVDGWRLFQRAAWHNARSAAHSSAGGRRACDCSLRRLPRGSALGARTLYLVPFGLAWEFCARSSAIHLSHWPYWTLGGALHHEWQFVGLL